eukprot:tig00001154_g7272.t1
MHATLQRFSRSAGRGASRLARSARPLAVSPSIHAARGAGQVLSSPVIAPSAIDRFGPSYAALARRPYSTEGDLSVKVPSMGESITEGTIVAWLKSPGDYIAMDEVVAQLETDKVTVDVRAAEAGTLVAKFAEVGETVGVGKTIASIKRGPKPEGTAAAKPAPAAKSAPAAAKAAPVAAPAAPTAAPAADSAPMPPKSTVVRPADQAPAPAQPLMAGSTDPRERRVPMSRMRRRIAERLKDSQNTAAMLTTFNEIDMSHLMAFRDSLKDEFQKKHGVKLGFMSAFVKAAAIALVEQPTVNAVIDGPDVVYRDYVDISVAVASPTGLVVPVIRNCDRLTFAGIEKTIVDLGEKAKNNTLSIEEMAGGTFTISNGGTFGSLLSTPIINPPQSAILGMHAINKRPVVVNDQIVIRPMMYVALTYDHRLIDGREAVTFLRRIKEVVEDPRRILLD